MNRTLIPLHLIDIVDGKEVHRTIPDGYTAVEHADDMSYEHFPVRDLAYWKRIEAEQAGQGTTTALSQEGHAAGPAFASPLRPGAAPAREPQPQAAASGHQSTSLQSLQRHRTSGKLSDEQRKILTCMALRPDVHYTMGEIGKRLGLPTGTVSARKDELVKLGEIEVCDNTRTCTVTHRTCMTLKLVSK